MRAEILQSNAISPDDIAQIIKLNNEISNERSYLGNPKDFHWLTNENPNGPALLPVVRDENGTIIASIIILPLSMTGSGGDFAGATATNLVIDEKRRGSLAYPMLMRQMAKAIRSAKIPYHFSFINQEAFDYEQRKSPESVARISTLIRSRFLGPIFCALRNRRANRSGNHETQRIEIMETSCEELDFDGLDLHHISHDFCTVKRTSEFLRWRFGASSSRPHLTLAAQVDGKTVGYLIASAIRFKGIKLGMIHDLQIERDRTGFRESYRLVRHLETILKRRGIHLSGAFASRKSRVYSILSRCGYLSLPSKIHHKRLGVFAHQSSGDFSACSNASDWHLNITE